METLPLARGFDDDEPSSVNLTIAIGNVAHGVTVACEASEALASVHSLELKIEVGGDAEYGLRLVRDNPFLSEAQLLDLDEEGLVRVGAIVRHGDVLASVVSCGNRLRLISEKKPSNDGMEIVGDKALRVPPGWKLATVTSVRRSPGGKLGERIEITIREERPLDIGDMLLIEGIPAVVSEILLQDSFHNPVATGADLLVSPKLGQVLGLPPNKLNLVSVAKLADRAATKLNARNCGPYSLISNAPLSRWPKAAAVVGAAEIEMLNARGFHALVGEFASLRGDDIVNRRELTSLVGATAGSVLEIAQSAAPLSLASILAHLRGLAFSVEVIPCDGHVALRVAPASDHEIVASSSGEVSKPHTWNIHSYAEEPGGLFAPEVFGDREQVRRRRFGHIALSEPVIPIYWRLGSPSPLEQATGLSTDDLARLLERRANVRWRSERAELVERARGGDAADPLCLGTGASAIQAIVERRTPTGTAPVPFAIKAIPILPPDWRPLVLLDNGNLATSDLNDLYREVVNRSYRLRKLFEMNAPEAILDAQRYYLQDQVDALFANGFVPNRSPIEGDVHRPFVSMAECLLRAIREREKKLDWSGSARVAPDPNVPSKCVLVPSYVFNTLRLCPELPLFLTAGDGRTFLARFPVLHDAPILCVSPETFAKLAGSDETAPVAWVHRPVTIAGRDEAIRMVNEAPSQHCLIDRRPSGSWFDSESSENLLERLAAAALAAENVPLNSPRGLLLGGTGSTQFADDGVVQSRFRGNCAEVPRR